MSKRNNWTLTKAMPPQDMWPDYDLIWARFIDWLHDKFNCNIGYWAEEEERDRLHTDGEITSPTVSGGDSREDFALDDEEDDDLWYGTYADIGDYVSNGEYGTEKNPKGGNVVGVIHDSYYRTVCYKILCTEYSDDDGHTPKSKYFDYMSPREITFHEPAGHISYVESFGYKLKWRLYRDGFKVGFIRMYYNKELKDWIYD